MQNNVAYCLLTEDGGPSTFHETIKSLDKSLWMTTMQEEIEALDKNKTWDLYVVLRIHMYIVLKTFPLSDIHSLFM